MKTINHSQLKKLIRRHYEQKIPFMIYGCFGIGKSEVIKKTAKEIAKDNKKEFVDWNYISDLEKRTLIGNTKGKFIFADERISQQEPSDIKGIPFFTDGFTEWKVPLLYKVMSEPEADGIIFFDELNVATPMMMNACLQIIHDRCIGNVALSKNVSIFGAGNRGSIDRASTFEEPYPLKDRKSEFELNAPSIDEWTSWGLSNGNDIDSRILGFLNFKPSRLLNVDFKSKDKSATPRGWHQLSKLIKDVNDEEILELLTAGRVGEAVSIEFMAFLKLNQKIDVKELLENPEKAKEIKEIDLKYAILSTVTEYFKRHRETKTLTQIIKLCCNIEVEFGVLLMRFVKAVDNQFFMDNVIKIKEFQEMEKSNSKYFFD